MSSRSRSKDSDTSSNSSSSYVSSSSMSSNSSSDSNSKSKSRSSSEKKKIKHSCQRFHHKENNHHRGKDKEREKEKEKGKEREMERDSHHHHHRYQRKQATTYRHNHYGKPIRKPAITRSRSRRDEKKFLEKQEEKKEMPLDTKEPTEVIANKPVMKGRGTRRKDDPHALLGWDDEDYLKVNKKLIDYGHKFKEFFNKKEHSSFALKEDTLNKNGSKGWRHDKYDDLRSPKRFLRASPKYGSE